MKNILPVLFILILSLSCKKAGNEIQNLNNGKILIIGHGGVGFETFNNHMPSNSLGSITRAVENLGADGVEVDVQLTADNELILYHDERLETQTNCNGCIRAHTAAALAECIYLQNLSTSVFSNEKLISLENILQRFSQRKIKPEVFLDLRVADGCESTENYNSFLDSLSVAVITIIDKYNYHENIYVESASVDLLKKVQQKNPGLKILIDQKYSAELLQTAVENNFYGIVTSNAEITKEDVKAAHEKNIRIVIFNLRSRGSHIEAVNKHPDFIQTDNIIVLQQILQH